MENRKIKKQKKWLTVLLLLLVFAETGCGDGRRTGETAGAAKTGALSYGYFYEEGGIVLSSKERFLYSDWEPVEFDYICMNPACSHLGGDCSARTISNEMDFNTNFSVIYQGRLIIVHSYARLVVDESSDETEEWSYLYQTDVYEAALDGSGRRKQAAFSGAIASPHITHAAVLADGRLYFSGEMEVRQSRGTSIETKISDAVYCLDLNDYSLKTFAVTEGREGPTYQYQLYEYDGMIYAIISNFPEDRAVWYRIDPAADTCEEILRFDSNVARFRGAIGDTVYYVYENDGKTLYARELAAGAAEREIMTVTEENLSAVTFIVDGQILFLTGGRYEGEDCMAEYAVLDPDGKVLDRIRYDDYITFLDVIGDRIVYFRTNSDCEEWWADKADLKELLEKGTPIGPFYGSRVDTLGN